MTIETSDLAEAVNKAQAIFRLCSELSEEFNRPISPDGHLVGGLGEIFAAARFGLTLEKPSTEGSDATITDGFHAGESVQIKATTRSSLTLSGERAEATWLAAVAIDRETAEPRFVYWGLAQPVWDRGREKEDRKMERQWTLSANIMSSLDSNELGRSGEGIASTP